MANDVERTPWPPNDMTTYIVQRVQCGVVQCYVFPVTGKLYILPHLMRHSPDGFEIGYSGSGPSDLARSIVGHLLNQRDPKPALYRPVVEHIISHLEGSGPFFISESSVRELCTRDEGDDGTYQPHQPNQVAPTGVKTA